MEDRVLSEEQIKIEDDWTPQEVLDRFPDEIADYINQCLATIRERDRIIIEYREILDSQTEWRRWYWTKIKLDEVKNQNITMLDALGRIDRLGREHAAKLLCCHGPFGEEIKMDPAAQEFFDIAHQALAEVDNSLSEVSRHADLELRAP